jgi:GNAT superfamily N-acetyltransferase
MPAGPGKENERLPNQLRVLPPERLGSEHDVNSFRNGKHPSLDDWLRDRALASEGMSARTYVACDADTKKRVVAYYAISTAMEQRIALPSAKLRRGMPEQIPLLLIGRLAIDQNYQGRGLGGDLLAHALRRCLAASEIAGVRGIVAHAIDDTAAGFYHRHGFVRSPLGERVMLMPIETVRALFQNS